MHLKRTFFPDNGQTDPSRGPAEMTRLNVYRKPEMSLQIQAEMRETPLITA